MRLGIGAGKTGQRLWEAMAEGDRQGYYFTDFWAADMAVIPSKQQTAVGKETGETAVLATCAVSRTMRSPMQSARIRGIF